MNARANRVFPLQLSNNAVASFEEVEMLTQLPNLTCLYLDQNPISKDFEYRKRLLALLPTLEQLDATIARRLA